MMNSHQIKLIITDFDGTLVDTFTANFNAYKEVLSQVNIDLTEQNYRGCFGSAFDDLMISLKITDPQIQNFIRIEKTKIYPNFFHLLRVNQILLDFILTFKRSGGLVALASTARRDNLNNVLNYLNISNIFDLVLSGENVRKPKPNHEIFSSILNHFSLKPHQTIIFEDSEVGIQAASNAGINYIRITKDYYGN